MSAMKQRIARIVSDAMFGHADEENDYTWGKSLAVTERILGEMYEPDGNMLSAGCRAPWRESIEGVRGIYMYMIHEATK